jgi:CRP-like cAMP-binding protein
MQPTSFKNKILQNLDSEIINRLDLHPVKLEQKREIEAPGNPIKNLYFIESGIGSMTTTFQDGSQVEVGMFGYESVMGASALMGTKRSLNKVYMQLSGHGFRCDMQVAEREFHRYEKFHQLVLRYVQAQLVQTCQSAGCNAKHHIRQRLSRWLLLCQDRSESDTLPLTHEFLADMLGTRRASVSLAAEMLKRRNLIEYRHGTVKILDRPGLERLSCECYRVVKNHLDSYIEVEQDDEAAGAVSASRI